MVCTLGFVFLPNRDADTLWTSIWNLCVSALLPYWSIALVADGGGVVAGKKSSLGNQWHRLVCRFFWSLRKYSVVGLSFNQELTTSSDMSCLNRVTFISPPERPFACDRPQCHRFPRAERSSENSWSWHKRKGSRHSDSSSTAAHVPSSAPVRGPVTTSGLAFSFSCRLLSSP